MSESLNINSARIQQMQEESMWNTVEAEQTADEQMATADLPYPIEIDADGTCWTNNHSTQLGRLER